MTSLTSTLSISISAPSIDISTGSVILEQEPISRNLGYLTKTQAVSMLGHIMHGTVLPTPFCPEDNGFEVDILAYPFPADLNYKTGVSLGNISGITVERIDFSEELRTNFALSIKPTYPVLSSISTSWVGGIYDRAGEVLQAPSVTVDGDNLIFSSAVYGVLKVDYDVLRYRYSVAVRPEAGGIENTLQSFFYAVWYGGNSYIEINIPDGAEDGICNNRGDTYSITSGETNIVSVDNRPNCVRPRDENVDVDYCTGEVI